MIKVRFKEDGEIPDFEMDFNEKEKENMENKYKELADKYNIEYEMEEKSDELDDVIEYKSKKYDEYDTKIVITNLVKVISDQERYLKEMERSFALEQESTYYYRREVNKLNRQIDGLKKIIDKLIEDGTSNEYMWPEENDDKSEYEDEDESEEIDKEDKLTENTTSFIYKDIGYGISFLHSINDLLLILNKDGLVSFNKNNDIIYDGEIVGKLGEDLYKTMKKISESDPDTLQMED